MDMVHRRLLDFLHFVVPGAGRLALLATWLLMAAVSVLSGCSRAKTPGQVEDSETSGRIQIASAPDVRALVAREMHAFTTVYPQAQLSLEASTSSAEAVAALYGGRADLAAIARELEAEERAMARKGGLELEGYRIARDAVCVIVGRDNPVENVSLDELRAIWSGGIRSWSALGGRDEHIVPVVQSPNSDLTRALVQQVMGDSSMTAPAHRESSDSAVVLRVATTRGAIGYVSLAAAASDDRIRSLHLAAMTGLSYVEPEVESVHSGTYPLTRYVNFYVRSKGPRLANGLITFATSQDGQRLVHESGQVPTAVPVRFVRRSPMLSTH